MHERQRVEGLGKHFACRNFRSGLSCEEIRLLGYVNLLSQAANLVGGYAANCFRPLGSLRGAVIGTQNVIFEIVFSGSALRHMVGVEANAILVEEVLVI